jgi:hypothetical protein
MDLAGLNKRLQVVSVVTDENATGLVDKDIPPLSEAVRTPGMG